MRVSVIVSTYNSPVTLRWTLQSLAAQSYADFELIVADDGSGNETVEVVALASETWGREIVHVWHEDRGFRKNTILNRAVLRSQGDYLVFTDGDCLLRKDFVQNHRSFARPNQTLSNTGHIELPVNVQSALSPEVIRLGLPFCPRWLVRHGFCFKAQREAHARLRLYCPAALGRCLDQLWYRRGGFVGCNSSVWKRDLLRVNGFDERYGHGLDDKDLAVRLRHSGIRARRLEFSLSYLHLSHPRPYTDDAAKREDQRRLADCIRTGATWTSCGITKKISTKAARAFR